MFDGRHEFVIGPLSGCRQTGRSPILPLMVFRRSILIFILAVSTATAGDPPSFHGRQRSFTTITPVTEAPITPMHTERGGITDLTRYRGRVVLLNLWATWCAACLRELPDLDQLQVELGGDDFTVVTLSLDSEGLKLVQPYFARLGITNLPAHTDPAGRAAEAFGVREGLPWSFVIDRQGRVRGYLMGAADWNSAEARALLTHYISGKP